MKFIESLIPPLVAFVFTVALRAWFLMFVAAVIEKRFGVWAAFGYPESVAWALAYGLVRGLWMKDEK